MQSWPVAIFGFVVLGLAIALAMMTNVRRGGRATVAGTAEILNITEPPVAGAYGRAEISAIVVAPGLGTFDKVIRDGRVPVAKWPTIGSTVPITVDVDDTRRVRVNWKDAPDIGAAGDPPPPAQPDLGTDPEETEDDDVLGAVAPGPWESRDDDWTAEEPAPAYEETRVTTPVVVRDTPNGPILEGQLVGDEEPVSPLPRRAGNGPRAEAGGFEAADTDPIGFDPIDLDSPAEPRPADSTRTSPRAAAGEAPPADPASADPGSAESGRAEPRPTSSESPAGAGPYAPPAAAPADDPAPAPSSRDTAAAYAAGAAATAAAAGAARRAENAPVAEPVAASDRSAAREGRNAAAASTRPGSGASSEAWPSASYPPPPGPGAPSRPSDDSDSFDFPPPPPPGAAARSGPFDDDEYPPPPAPGSRRGRAPSRSEEFDYPPPPAPGLGRPAPSIPTGSDYPPPPRPASSPSSPAPVRTGTPSTPPSSAPPSATTSGAPSGPTTSSAPSAPATSGSAPSGHQSSGSQSSGGGVTAAAFAAGLATGATATGATAAATRTATRRPPGSRPSPKPRSSSTATVEPPVTKPQTTGRPPTQRTSTESAPATDPLIDLELDEPTKPAAAPRPEPKSTHSGRTRFVDQPGTPEAPMAAPAPDAAVPVAPASEAPSDDPGHADFPPMAFPISAYPSTTENPASYRTQPHPEPTVSATSHTPTPVAPPPTAPEPDRPFPTAPSPSTPRATGPILPEDEVDIPLDAVPESTPPVAAGIIAPAAGSPAAAKTPPVAEAAETLQADEPEEDLPSKPTGSPWGDFSGRQEPDIHAADLITAYPSARPGPAGAIHGVGITILVTDLERSIRFYRDTLGFFEIDTGDGSSVLASGDTRVVLRTVPNLSSEAGRLIYLNLEVGDIEAVHDELKAKGVKFVHSPRPVNRGDKLELWSATFRDPDNHNIAITQWRAIRPDSEA
ncbi:VOC family protein [Actinoplanes sp. HUAS TT8]|uniref:VOC family protein n=1 Tax=Actinoplanes sp. HUAS TT8 TaxID=3447453 RepID=UPI003F520CB3